MCLQPYSHNASLQAAVRRFAPCRTAPCGPASCTLTHHLLRALLQVVHPVVGGQRVPREALHQVQEGGAVAGPPVRLLQVLWGRAGYGGRRV